MTSNQARKSILIARRKQKRRAISFVGNIRQTITTRFGIAVKQTRLRLGITQSELASAADLSRSYLSEVECGRESISLERAERLARALNCELSELLKED